MAESENEQERPCLHCLQTDRRLLRRISVCPGRVRHGRYGRSGRNYRGCREDRGRTDLSARRYVSPVSDRPIDARDHEIRRRISSRRRSRFSRSRKTTLTSSPQRTAGSRRRDGQAATQPDTSTETNPCALRNARPHIFDATRAKGCATGRGRADRAAASCSGSTICGAERVVTRPTKSFPKRLARRAVVVSAWRLAGRPFSPRHATEQRAPDRIGQRLRQPSGSYIVGASINSDAL